MAQPATPENLIARQPIFDRRMRVYGYEILYRDNPEGWDPATFEGDRATSSVLMDMFTFHDLDRLVGGHQAFINLTQTFLEDPSILPLSKDRLVLEVLENIPVTDELIGAVRRLAANGYTIALDDFILDDRTLPLAELAHVIKIDIRQLSEAQVKEHVSRLKRFPAHLLAEKVEDHDELEFCKSQGFHFFQGFFLSRPRIIKSKRLPADRVRVLNLLQKLQDPEASLREITELVSKDVYLSYRLLRLINSAYFPIRTQIESIHRAVVYLGLKGVRTWATWIVMSGIRDKPAELKTLALIRAQMVTELAEELELGQADRAFTVGLFSTLDALLDLPLEEGVGTLPLVPEVKEALLDYEGSLGAVLHAVLAYEGGDWEEALRVGVEPARLKEIYLDSVDWAQTLGMEMDEAHSEEGHRP
jgi:EAL and modified HD-GYP domain-containing signal transduction protein